MRSTLFYLPHQLLGIPLFGFGWMLGLLLLAVIVWFVVNQQRLKTTKQLQESLPMWLVAALLILFFFPRMEAIDPNGRPIGMPIRGYGLMLMSGAIAGITLTMRRAKPLGLSLDHLLSLATWGFIPGILGARLFYVIQKWSELPGADLSNKLLAALKFTEGGLVVYGGIIGGLIGTSAWCLRKKFPLFAIADLVVPGFFIGLAFGRIGCLLHGCCFGGPCNVTYLPSIRFPSGSEPYMAQIERGPLLGVQFRYDDGTPTREIAEITPDSWADHFGLKPGQVLDHVDYRLLWPTPPQDPAGPHEVQIASITVNGQTNFAPQAALPDQTLPLHPAQIYSSINAGLLCLFLYCLWPLPKHDGYVLAAGLSGYAIVRIFEEIIRADELAVFGSTLTISQWVSIGGLLLALLILFIQRHAPRTYRFSEAGRMINNV